MSTSAPTPNAQPRPPYRPPIGIPLRGEPRLRSTLVSVALHALVIVLVLSPALWMAATIAGVTQSAAGGMGTAGGGGGGTAGTGGATLRERIRLLYFVGRKQTLTVPPPETPPPTPIVEKTPEPPEPVPEPPTPQPPKVEPTPQQTATSPDASQTSGSGGGSGKDGTAGNGPGSGGGVGSGVGTGRGSGTGPGTGGGGDDSIYPPAVIALPILPLPVPGKVRPYKLVAYFEVDTLGNAKLLAFNPSNDGSYNKRIREMLSEIRFRPAVRLNGRPVLDTAIISAEAPRS